MRFLLDQGVPQTSVDLLNARNMKAEHVSRLGMSRSGDAEILQHARDHGFVVVTLDADFHTLLALSGASAPSVIRVRVQGLDAGKFTDTMMVILPDIAESIERGAAVTVTATRIRIRHLPIKASDYQNTQ
ncbi:MAG: hypothetical protein FKY71_15875 [Spiribacter salinus]|uniref:DUF5615 domain-containing protein n=1 Tax=Spiribacter salinus TaxID=1335746 RepID=A0A540VM05_9GAMM|nr:MAG: hypothetical protein FKY71_15875 [Spiribacter salinus]